MGLNPGSNPGLTQVPALGSPGLEDHLDLVLVLVMTHRLASCTSGHEIVLVTPTQRVQGALKAPSGITYLNSRLRS